MHKNLFFFCFACFTALGCGIFCKIPPPRLSDYDTYFKDTCFYKSRPSFSKRMRKFPFKVAKRIEIVSFYNHIPPKKSERDSIDHYNTFFERLSLSQNDIDTLSQILHFSLVQIQVKPLPKGYKKPTILLNEYRCFFVPRHALLFYDKNDKLYLRWDICFECEQNDAHSVNYNTDVVSLMCSNQYETLRLLFKRIGIKQFINPERPE